MFLQEPLFYELNIHKLNWTCSFKFSAFETRSFHKTIHPWKPDVFHENHVLELECSNFDAYGWFILIAPITILFPQIQWIVEPSQVQFSWFGCFYLKPLYVGYKTWISTWLSRSWETIEANNGKEELNKPSPWSSFEDLCPKHYKWKYLPNKDSMALWLALMDHLIMKDIAQSTPWLRPWMSTILKFINPIEFWLENTFLVLPCF